MGRSYELYSNYPTNSYLFFDLIYVEIIIRLKLLMGIELNHTFHDY